jgi:hypothetical protein
MTAAETIQLARREGVRLRVRQSEVTWEGTPKPSPLLLANLNHNQKTLLAQLASPLDEEDKALLREVGLSPEDPAVATALRLFGGRVRAVRKAGLKTWIQRKGKGQA